MRGIRVDLERLRGAISNQKAFAEKFGITRQTLYKKLHGAVGISFDDLNRMAHQLERDADDFIIWFDYKTEEASPTSPSD